MAKVVWKYEIDGPTQLHLPKGAKFLTVGAQNDTVCVWAEVDPDETETELRCIDLVGTGHPIYHTGVYLGTAIIHNQMIRNQKSVMHVYEIEG